MRVVWVKIGKLAMLATLVTLVTYKSKCLTHPFTPNSSMRGRYLHTRHLTSSFPGVLITTATIIINMGLNKVLARIQVRFTGEDVLQFFK